MTLPVFTTLLYLATLGLQISAITIAYRLLSCFQRARSAQFFLFFSLSTILVQYTYLFLTELASATTNLSNALLAFGNTLVIWAVIFLINRFLGRTKNRVLELAKEVKFDPLTRVLSRNAILFYCEHELAKAQRTRCPVSILVIDMDRFKQINDFYGHPIGDEVLVKSTRHCMQALREIDLIGRIGGDEFIILLPNTDFHAANEVAKRIKKEMQTLHTNLSITISTPITLSIGIANYCPKATSYYQQRTDVRRLLHELITISDQSMYAEKRSNHLRYRYHQMT